MTVSNNSIINLYNNYTDINNLEEECYYHNSDENYRQYILSHMAF
jgi:hypothetical protein